MKSALIRTIEKKIPVTREEAARILSPFQQKHFKRYEVLLQSGKIAREVFFVLNGLLHQYYIHDDGKERTCELGVENKFITDLESFTKKIPSTSFINALKPTTCLAISCENLTQLTEESAVARDFFNAIVEQIATESMQRTRLLLTFSPEQRFVELMARQPEIFQQAPQRYLAQYLGIAPESLSRIKKRLMRFTKS